MLVLLLTSMLQSDRASQSQMVLGDSGTRTNNNITFGNGYTLTMSNNALKFKFNSNTQSVVFNGSILQQVQHR